MGGCVHLIELYFVVEVCELFSPRSGEQSVAFSVVASELGEFLRRVDEAESRKEVHFLRIVIIGTSVLFRKGILDRCMRVGWKRWGDRQALIGSNEGLSS